MENGLEIEILVEGESLADIEIITYQHRVLYR